MNAVHLVLVYSTSNESSTTDEVPSDITGGSNDSEMPDALSTLTDSLLGEFDSTITSCKFTAINNSSVNNLLTNSNV